MLKAAQVCGKLPSMELTKANARKIMYISITEKIAGGLTQLEACAEYGISTKTYQRMQKDYEEVSSALVLAHMNRLIQKSEEVIDARIQAIDQLIFRINDSAQLEDMKSQEIISISAHLGKVSRDIEKTISTFGDNIPQPVDADEEKTKPAVDLGGIELVEQVTTTTKRRPVIEGDIKADDE